MSIKIVQERKAKNGTIDSALKEFVKDSVVIGRAGDCDLVLRGAEYALKHARIVRDGASFLLEDLDPVYEVTLNGKLIQRAALKRGDTFRLSGARFKVTQLGESLEITHYIDEDSGESVEARHARYAKSLDIHQALPSLRVLSLLLMLAVVVLVGLYPELTGERRHLQVGPVTNHHRMIEAQCSHCHSGNFERVADAACQSCHKVSTHAAVFAKAGYHATLAKNCVECHREHGGSHALVPPESKLCADCHGQIKSVHPDSKLGDIPTWDRHPEFSITLQSDRLEGKAEVVSLADKSKLRDNSHLKLNHALHLKPQLRGATGPVTLQCVDCHALGPDFETILPIAMEANCKSCHTLQFDERLGEQEVPHAEPDIVYKFLYAEYAKLLLADQSDSASPVRLKPGSAPDEPEARTAFVRSEVEKEARNAERELFTRTACKTCHEVSEVSGPDVEAEQKSRFAILKPQIPQSWMPAARFNHGSHEELSCESCHVEARKSEMTTDVLLPTKASCEHCHASQAGGGKLQSDCVLCHSYHDSLPLDLRHKKQWKLTTAVATELEK